MPPKYPYILVVLVLGVLLGSEAQQAGAWCWLRDAGTVSCGNNTYQQNCCSGNLRVWNGATMQYQISTSTNSTLFNSIRAGVNTWTNVPMSTFTFTEGAQTNTWDVLYDGVNVVNIDSDFCTHYPSYCGMGILGFSNCVTIGSGTSSYQSVDCDVVLNGEEFTWGDGSSGTIDTPAVITHEAGHNAGLSHPGSTCREQGSSGCGAEFEQATMYWNYAAGEPTDKASLELDDMAALVHGYPVSTVRIKVVGADDIPIEGASVELLDTAAPVNGTDIASGGQVHGDITDSLTGDRASSATYVTASPFTNTDAAGYTNYISPLQPSFSVTVSKDGASVTEQISVSPGISDVTVQLSTALPAPTNVSASDGTYSEKVEVTWDSVEGANYYRVYRNTSNNWAGATALSTWQAGTSYQDTTASPAATYYYWVKAATTTLGGNASSFSASDSGWRALTPPTGVAASDGTYADRVYLNWNSTTGASYYRVYRNTTSLTSGASAVSNWQTSRTSYDYSVTPGQTYYYWVKAAVSGTGTKASDFGLFDTGWSSLAQPTGVAASDGTHADRVLISWNSTTGASYYRVYRNTSSSSAGAAALSGWQTATTFDDATATPGQTYYYWGKAAVSSTGEHASDLSASNSGWRALSAPASVSASDGSYADKIHIAWESAAGASYYQLYRNTTNTTSGASALSGWQTGTTYDDTSAVSGQTYYYWVKAAISSTGTRSSDFSAADSGWRALAAPAGVTASDGAYTDKVRVTWNSVSGASHYQVYRNTTNDTATASVVGSWQSGTTYDDTSTASGQTYYYWVRAAADSSGAHASPFSSADTGYAAIPRYTSYLAEGYTGPGFDTYLLLLNPNAYDGTQVDVTFMREDGTTVPYSVTLPALTRLALNAADYVPNQGFSIQVESDLQVAAERSMYWDAGGIATAEGHNSLGMSALNTTWYLAEGYNSTNSYNFETYLLLANPNSAAAEVTVTFMLENGDRLTYRRQLPATSRQTISTNQLIPQGGFSMKIESTQPIMAERAMYWSAGGVTLAGGHNTVAIAEPAALWYLAEGYNSSSFATYILLMNPNTRDTYATVTFMKEDGTTTTYSRHLPAQSRQTIITSQIIPSGGFATKVEANVPILVERAMYWTAGGVPTAAGHDTVGVSTLARQWYLAEGYASDRFRTYILLMNPNPNPARVQVTLIKDDGSTVTYLKTVAATSRATIAADSLIDSGGFGATIESNLPIMVERAMYWDAGGVANIGGHCSIGVAYQSSPQTLRLSDYQLTVVTAGAGSGRVVGEGIDCGADCSAEYAEGTVLNLKAIPEADSTFAGWLINGEAVTGPIAVDRDMIVTAIFEKP